MAKTLVNINPAEDESATAEVDPHQGNPTPHQPSQDSRPSPTETAVTALDTTEPHPEPVQSTISEKTSEGGPSTQTPSPDQAAFGNGTASEPTHEISPQLEDESQDISHVWEENLEADADPVVEDQMVLTAVLLPRSPKHQLNEPLAAYLNSSMAELAHLWSWEVNDIDIQQEYLCFSFTLPSSIPPAGGLEQMRQELSSRVLTAFPDLEQDIPEGRFWAHNYLLTTGGAPSEARIRIFIENTRRSQEFES
jgi:REP element-mobilizing transposase RayT